MATFISNGTPITSPSPQYDIPLVSNNGVLKASYNMTNYGDSNWKSGYFTTFGSIGGANAGQDEMYCETYYPVTVGNSYTFSFSYAGDTLPSNTWACFVFYDSSKNFISRSTNSQSIARNPKTYTTTIPSGCSYIRISLRTYKSTDNAVYNVQLEKGGSATTYHPYGFYTEGITETIWTHTKNLFDENNIILGYFYEDNGTYTSNANTFTSGKIPMNAGTTVTFSRGLSANNVFLRIHAFNSNNEWIGLVAKSTSPSSLSTTGTTPANTSYIRVCGAKRISGTEIDHECQVELGSTATAYIPYYNGGTATCENLLSVDTYKDTQEILSGSLIRNIGVKVLDGTENWVQSNTKNDVYRLTETTAKREQMAIYATHFVGTSEADVNMPDNSIKLGSCAAVPDYGVLAIRLSNVTTLSQFQQWLADQYAAGTPVIIVYPLATETTESVTAQPMETVRGDNICDITQASLSGLELSVKYIKGV